MSIESRSPKDAFGRGYSPGWGECGALRMAIHPVLGEFRGISLPALRPGWEVLPWMDMATGVTPVQPPRPRPWPELSLGTTKLPLARARGGTAGRRACLTGRAPPDGAEEKDQAPAGVSASFFVFCFFSFLFFRHCRDFDRPIHAARGPFRISKWLSSCTLA